MKTIYLPRVFRYIYLPPGVTFVDEDDNEDKYLVQFPKCIVSERHPGVKAIISEDYLWDAEKQHLIHLPFPHFIMATKWSCIKLYLSGSVVEFMDWCVARNVLMYKATTDFGQLKYDVVGHWPIRLTHKYFFLNKWIVIQQLFHAVMLSMSNIVDIGFILTNSSTHLVI